MLGLIEKEREGEVVDRELLKSVINVRIRYCNINCSVSHKLIFASIGVCGDRRLETSVSYSRWRRDWRHRCCQIVSSHFYPKQQVMTGRDRVIAMCVHLAKSF